MEKKLKTYRSKRAFNDTPEPSGRAKRGNKKAESGDDGIFVVQKHDARNLHYDFRLEIAGVLVSWAIPKNPPSEVGEKRLAIRTEDHPIEYAQFEGIIPEGQYGAGTVEIWDRGVYINKKEENGKSISMEDSLKMGRLEFFLKGKKMKGPFALIKTNMSGENQWLIIKMKQKKVA